MMQKHGYERIRLPGSDESNADHSMDHPVRRKLSISVLLRASSTKDRRRNPRHAPSEFTQEPAMARSFSSKAAFSSSIELVSEIRKEPAMPISFSSKAASSSVELVSELSQKPAIARSLSSKEAFSSIELVSELRREPAMDRSFSSRVATAVSNASAAMGGSVSSKMDRHALLGERRWSSHSYVHGGIFTPGGKQWEEAAMRDEDEYKEEEQLHLKEEENMGEIVFGKANPKCPTSHTMGGGKAGYEDADGKWGAFPEKRGNYYRIEREGIDSSTSSSGHGQIEKSTAMKVSPHVEGIDSNSHSQVGRSMSMRVRPYREGANNSISYSQIERSSSMKVRKSGEGIDDSTSSHSEVERSISMKVRPYGEGVDSSSDHSQTEKSSSVKIGSYAERIDNGIGYSQIERSSSMKVRPYGEDGIDSNSTGYSQIGRSMSMRVGPYFSGCQVGKKEKEKDKEKNGRMSQRRTWSWRCSSRGQDISTSIHLKHYQENHHHCNHFPSNNHNNGGIAIGDEECIGKIKAKKGGMLLQTCKKLLGMEKKVEKVEKKRSVVATSKVALPTHVLALKF